MNNPYTPPTTPERSTADDASLHPDWKWMVAIVYVFSLFCMAGILGTTNPPNSRILGFGHGPIRGPAMLGNVGFVVAIPLLAVIPVTIVALPFRFFYRASPQPKSKTFANFVFLLFGFIVAIINASLYRGD